MDVRSKPTSVSQRRSYDVAAATAERHASLFDPCRRRMPRGRAPPAPRATFCFGLDRRTLSVWPRCFHHGSARPRFGTGARRTARIEDRETHSSRAAWLDAAGPRIFRPDAVFEVSCSRPVPGAAACLGGGPGHWRLRLVVQSSTPPTRRRVPTSRELLTSRRASDDRALLPAKAARQLASLAAGRLSACSFSRAV